MIRLANTPTPHVITMAHSVLCMFQPDLTPEDMQCAASAPEVACAQGAVSKTQSSFIAPADWDELFVAVQNRLECCVGDTLNHSPALPLQDQKLVVKKAVLESVEALRNLHYSLLLERQSGQRR